MHSEDEDSGDVELILEGNLMVDHSPQFRSIRLFVSCDPEDSVWEHRMIEHYVLGELKSHCESLSFHFHLVNPCYGGGQNNALDKVELKELCLKEIKLCQKYSIGPNFLSLLSHHYGWKGLPRIIPEVDFNLFYKNLSVDDRPAYKTLKRLYVLDKNAVPQAYCLDTSTLKSLSLKECETLSRALRRAARQHFSGKDKNKVQTYMISTLEEEVIQGVFNCPVDPNKRCCWMKRTFTDLHNQKATDPLMKVFCDLTVDGAEMDQETQKTLGHLKEARMTAKYIGLEAPSIMEFPIKWVKGRGLDPQHDSAHSKYLLKACTTCVEHLKDRISSAVDEYNGTSGSALYKEVLFHGHYCKERAKDFKIHLNLLQKVQEYLNSPSQQPFIVCGFHGYGKTTLMAASARYHKERHPNRNSCLVLRFLAMSSQSQSIRRTLSSICQQIHCVYKGTELGESHLHSYQSILSEFHHLLRTCPSEKKPLYLFLDAVDHLAPEDGAHGLFWVPSPLPPHVKLIISTSLSSGCYTAAKGLLQSAEDNVLQVPCLDNSTAGDLLSLSLGENRRGLTKEQEETVLQKLTSCPSPLYLSLLCNTLQSVRHCDAIPYLPSSVMESVDNFLEGVEAKCGKVIVAKVASFVTLSRSGLTEAEIMDLISTNDEVVEYVKKCCPVFAANHAKRGNALVPSFLWSRLLHELFPLMEYHQGEGNTLTLAWKHDLLRNAVKGRYLPDEESQRKVFHHLAKYFSGKMRCMKQGKDEVQYSVEDLSEIEDPLEAQYVFENVYYGERRSPYLKQEFQMNETTPNCRTVIELPHALGGCGQVDELRDLLCNLNWQLTVIKGFSSSDIVSEFNRAAPLVPQNIQVSLDTFELRTVREALVMSSEMLSESNELLPQILVGRLLTIVKDTSVPRPLIVNLCEQALDRIEPDSVLPYEDLPESPGRALLAILEGHRDAVTGLVCKEKVEKSSNRSGHFLLSCSRDGSLKSWDLFSGGVTQTLLGHVGGVRCLDMTGSCSHAVSGGTDGTVRMWDLEQGALFKTMEGHKGEVTGVALTESGDKAVSGSVDDTVKIWNTDLKSGFCGELIYTIDNKGFSVCALVMVKEDSLFACGDQDGRLSFWNLISGELLQCISAHSGPVSSVAVVQGEKKDVGNSDSSPPQIISASSGDEKVRMFDFNSGRLVNSTNSKGSVSVVSATSHVFVSGTEAGSLSVWDVNGFSHKHLLASSSETSAAITALCLADNGRLVFSSDTEGKIKAWELFSSQSS